MLARFVRQFSGPTGALGRVAGLFMARKNRALNEWIVALLDAGPTDRVVEIGYGPGLAVAANAARATGGLVAGVDRSAVMHAQARRRNAAALKAGRVDLRVGDAASLPFATASFTRALAVNSLQFWQPPEAGLRELARVLAPGARLVLAQRLHRPDAGRFDRSRFGMTDYRLAALAATLAHVGFRDVAVTRRAIAGETIAGIRAERAVDGR
jgi:ubiquinone/menaquinone biosynthesis C-methylase UbiE